MSLNISRTRDFLKVLNLQRLHTYTYTQVQVWAGYRETGAVNHCKLVQLFWTAIW